MNENYTKEELLSAKFGCLTMGDLAEFVYNNSHIPRDTKVLIERIEDIYFEKYNWKVLEVQTGEYEEDKNEFFPAWCISKDRNEDFIYIYNHY